MSVFATYLQENQEQLSLFFEWFETNNIELKRLLISEVSDSFFSSKSDDICFVFLSDNLLKSYSVEKLFKNKDDERVNNLIYVLIDGKKNDNGKNYYPTSINGVLEILQYRDYWYEEWIRLSKLHNLTNKVDADIESQKDCARRISTNIALFLKNIVPNHHNLNDLVSSNFKFIEELFSVEILVNKKSKLHNVESDEIIIYEPTSESDHTNSFEKPVITKIIEDRPKDEFMDEIENNFENLDNSMENMKYPSPDSMEKIDELSSLYKQALNSEEYTIARAYLERILQISAMDYSTLRNLAILLANKFTNETQLADEYFKKALFFLEDDAHLFYEYGKHLSDNLKAYQKSSDMLQRAIEIDPSLDKAYLSLAVSLHYIGQDISAKANYLQACIIDSSNRTSDFDLMFGVYNPTPDSDSLEAIIEEPVKHPNEDTVVLVTGSTSGIGKAVAELFAANGFKIILTGRREERLIEIKEDFESRFPTQVQILNFDIRNPESVFEALDKLPDVWKNIDILINNAGLAKGRAPIHLGNMAHWETMIDTNIKGLLYITRAVTPIMVERQKGFIINIGSIAGKEAYADGNVYCATKAAVEMLTKGMRLDLHKHGIRVAAVHPGHVETEFALVRFDGDENKANIYEQFTPLTAMDVADTVYYIATRPQHVNIQDVLMFSSQQASASVIDMSGKKFMEEQ